MKITVTCLAGDVNLVAGECFVRQSADMQRTLALFGGDTIYVDDKVLRPLDLSTALTWIVWPVPREEGYPVGREP